MQQGSLRLFIIVLLVSIFAMPNWAVALHACEPVEGALESSENASQNASHVNGISEHSSDKDRESSNHDKDCSCPVHRTGCCHSHVFLSRGQIPVLATLSSASKFSDFSAFIKPGPFLEGPFQPPRA